MADFQNINLWQNLNGKINATNEFRLPVSHVADAPELGAGSKRWNDLIEQEETWNGVSWVITGAGADGIVTGSYDTTGDGLTSSFLIPVDLSILDAGQLAALEFTITPITSESQGIYSMSAGSTGLTVNYDVCPDGDLKFNYTIKMP